MPKQPASIPEPDSTDDAATSEPVPTEPTTPPTPRSALDDPSHPLHHLRDA